MLLDDCAPGEEILSELPIFPLPNAVLLPGVVLPLNVFEPRYLDLVDHALGGSRYIGIPLLKPGYERDYEGCPAVEPVFGIGRLLSHQRLPDGRRFIRLEGVRRVELVRELGPRASFRELEVRLLPEDHPSDRDKIEILKAQLERISLALCPDDAELLASLLRIPDDRVLVYAMAALLPMLGLVAETPVELRSATVEVQQRCVAAERCDDRIEVLLESADALCGVLSDAGRFPQTLMN